MNLEIKNSWLIKNNKFKDAILNLDELIKDDQNNVNYYHLREISYLRVAKFDFAKNDFDKLPLNLIFLMFIIILMCFIFQMVKMNLQ